LNWIFEHWSIALWVQFSQQRIVLSSPRVRTKGWPSSSGAIKKGDLNRSWLIKSYIYRMRWNSYSRYESIISEDKKVDLWRICMMWWYVNGNEISTTWFYCNVLMVTRQVGHTISCLIWEKIIGCFFRILAVPTTDSLDYHHFLTLIQCFHLLTSHLMPTFLHPLLLHQEPLSFNQWTDG